jgi:thymidylate synthase (FAD)
MPQARLKVKLLASTPEPQLAVSMGARLCYSDASIDELMEAGESPKLIQRLMDMGHLSPIEHASFTFGIEGVSRVLLAQITRHRIASFSVQSQRYVCQSKGAGEFLYIVPPAIEKLGEEAVLEYKRQMSVMQEWYGKWIERLGGEGEGVNEDARFVLPNACETKLIMTMNARELLHFFSIRCCNRAQWEIRELAWEMLTICRREAPDLFKNAGPTCVQGPCGEGKMSCGKAEEVRQKHAHLT